MFGLSSHGRTLSEEKNMKHIKTSFKTLSIAALFASLSWGSQAQTIQMKPRCDSVSILYPSDVSTSVDVINLPYKQVSGETAGYFHPLLGQIPSVIYYTYHDGGPKVELLDAVTIVKLDYSTDLAKVLLRYQVCLADVGGTYFASIAKCLIDYPLTDTSEATTTLRTACTDAALITGGQASEVCKAERDASTFSHMSAAISDIDSFISLYGGCESLAAHIESWERYWADE